MPGQVNDPAFLFYLSPIKCYSKSEIILFKTYTPLLIYTKKDCFKML